MQGTMLPFEAFILIDDSLRRAEIPAQDRIHHVTLNSNFTSHGKSQPKAYGTTPVRSISLARAQAETLRSLAALKSPSDPKKGRITASPRTDSDLVTEQHLITLLQKLGPTLKHLHLSELAFTAFRRQHLTQLTPLLSSSNLQTLTVIGRSAIQDQVQFHALASILLCLPNLSTLVIRHIRAYTPAPSASMGRMPSFNLVSISVRDCTSFVAEHYFWLFASTMYADSLRVLDFEYPHPRAAPLRPVAWLGWPVRSLRLTTSAKGVIEGFAHNLPSLEKLEINATDVGVDIIKLLGNLQKPPVELADTSVGEEDGFDPKVMAVVLEVGWPRTQFRKICIRRRQGWARLEAACRAKAVELIELK